MYLKELIFLLSSVVTNLGLTLPLIGCEPLTVQGSIRVLAELLLVHLLDFDHALLLLRSACIYVNSLLLVGIEHLRLYGLTHGIFLHILRRRVVNQA